jgi:hypothetical protein
VSLIKIILYSQEPRSFNQSKMVMSIKESSKFRNLLPNTLNQAAFYRSYKYGAIFSYEIQNLLAPDNPHYIVDMNDLIADHKELKEETRDNDDLSDYYVFASFMPPGDNKIIVSRESIIDKSCYYLMDSVTPIRTEEVSYSHNS